MTRICVSDFVVCQACVTVRVRANTVFSVFKCVCVYVCVCVRASMSRWIHKYTFDHWSVSCVNPCVCGCVSEGQQKLEVCMGFVGVNGPSGFPLKSCMTSFGMTTQNIDRVRPLASFKCHNSYWKRSSSVQMCLFPTLFRTHMHVSIYSCVTLCNSLLVETR